MDRIEDEMCIDCKEVDHVGGWRVPNTGERICWGCVQKRIDKK